MQKKTLSVLLVILFVCFLIILGFIFYYSGFLDKNKEESNVQETELNRNVTSLKSMKNFTDILVLETIDKDNGFISVRSFSQEKTNKYRVDSNTILICLDSSESLETRIDFSRLNVWSNDLNKFFDQNESFYENNIEKSVRLVLISDYVSTIMIGGCQ